MKAALLSVLLLPGCASQEAYRGYLDASRSSADAYYGQKPIVTIACQPTCTFSSLEVRAPLNYQAPQQIVNENAGFTSLLGNIIPALGLRRPGDAADVIRAAGEAFKTPNVTTTTSNTSTSTSSTATNTSTTSQSHNPSNTTTTTTGAK